VFKLPGVREEKLSLISMNNAAVTSLVKSVLAIRHYSDLQKMNDMVASYFSLLKNRAGRNSKHSEIVRKNN